MTGPPRARHAAPSAGRTIVRLARALERTLMEVDLTLAQYRILAFLTGGTTAASKVAEAMTVSRPSVTVVVDGLSDRGFVRRDADPSDRRRAGIVLTREGVAALARADAAVAARLDALLAMMPEHERAAAITALGSWERALESE